MATYLLGHQAILTLTGTGTPTSADAFNVYTAAVRPLVDVTVFQATRRRYRASIQSGGAIRFDVMVDDDGTTPPIPQNTELTITIAFVSGQSWAGKVILESAQAINLTMRGDTHQYVRYSGNWTTDAITVT